MCNPKIINPNYITEQTSLPLAIPEETCVSEKRKSFSDGMNFYLRFYNEKETSSSRDSTFHLLLVTHGYLKSNLEYRREKFLGKQTILVTNRT